MGPIQDPDEKGCGTMRARLIQQIKGHKETHLLDLETDSFLVIVSDAMYPFLFAQCLLEYIAVESKQDIDIRDRQ